MRACDPIVTQSPRHRAAQRRTCRGFRACDSIATACRSIRVKGLPLSRVACLRLHCDDVVAWRKAAEVILSRVGYLRLHRRATRTPVMAVAGCVPATPLDPARPMVAAYLSRAVRPRPHCDSSTASRFSTMAMLSWATCLRLHCDPTRGHTETHQLSLSRVARLRPYCDKIKAWRITSPPYCRGLRACDSIATATIFACGAPWKSVAGWMPATPLRLGAAEQHRRVGDLSRDVCPRPHCDSRWVCVTCHDVTRLSRDGCLRLHGTPADGGVSRARHRRDVLFWAQGAPLCRGLRACDSIARFSQVRRARGRPLSRATRLRPHCDA
jgi:hypothetical protein